MAEKDKGGLHSRQPRVQAFRGLRHAFFSKAIFKGPLTDQHQSPWGVVVVVGGGGGVTHPLFGYLGFKKLTLFRTKKSQTTFPV